MREGISYVFQEIISSSVAEVIPAKNKNLCKFWDGILSQKRKRMLEGTGKHKADQVGWNGVLYLDNSHSRGHWAALAFFHVIYISDNWLTLRVSC